MSDHSYRLKYVLVGASGIGKSTMAAVLESRLGMKRCITCTTRPPRPGEVHGVDYYFVPHMDAQSMFEHAAFGGYEYGMEREELYRGDFVILEPQGVNYYRDNYPAPLSVILLVRDGIEVDAARMARDADAGFDQVSPDYIVRGNTIEEMSSNLLDVIARVEQQPLISQTEGGIASMRDWLSELDQIDRDCVHQYEYLLGRKLSGYEEYSEIDRQVDEMILDYSSRKDFFEDYPELKKYAKKPSSLDDRIDSAVSRSAGSNSNQLNHLETSSNHEPETLRRS